MVVTVAQRKASSALAPLDQDDFSLAHVSRGKQTSPSAIRRQADGDGGWRRLIFRHQVVLGGNKAAHDHIVVVTRWRQAWRIWRECE